MTRQKLYYRILAALLAGALLAALLSGCARTGETAFDGIPENTSGQQVSVSSEPAQSTPETPEETPDAGSEKPDGQETDRNPESEPVEDPGPAVEPTPDASPEVKPEPTPEPTPKPTPEPEPTQSADPQPSSSAEIPVADITHVEADLEDEAVALSSAPAALSVHVRTTVASGERVKENVHGIIDYSNAEDGYVMVQYTGQSEQRLKVQVKGPTTTYTYNLPARTWEAFPLSDGNGVYQITVYQNVTGNRYAALLSMNTVVELENEFAPFLHSNQYVDYDNAPNTVAKAQELTGAVDDPLKKVEIVYNYVVKGMTYDKQLAATVKSGYLPVLDRVLEEKTGICFDYAALMTGMLRSQGVPCKLVVGYAGKAYHAWISVWVDGSGWVDGVVWFDGSCWQRMDPTFASSAKNSASILTYIGDGANYTAKYFY